MGGEEQEEEGGTVGEGEEQERGEEGKGEEKGIERRSKRRRERGRKEGREGKREGEGSRSPGGPSRFWPAHMSAHLPLMRSALFCLLERLPSTLRLTLRRVSSVSSSWNSSFTL